MKYKKGDLVKIKWDFLSHSYVGVVVGYTGHWAYPIKIYHFEKGISHHREEDLENIS